ncbi:MAG: hypothetical protein K6F42_07920 [Bacteroidales bacterium]|nr:hypothetical protein [Bacteroidales bacterium]
MRKRIYEIIEFGRRGGTASVVYEYLMLVAIIALPSGVITASYLNELRNERNNNGKS